MSLSQFVAALRAVCVQWLLLLHIGQSKNREWGDEVESDKPSINYLTASFEWRFTVVTLVAFLAASNSAVGQWMGRQTSCYADPIAANPNRPTVTNPAHVTQYGVLELEYGWDRFWPEEGTRQTSLGGLLKFGMFCDIELRWNTTSFLSQTDAGGTHQTFGDNWL
ncbi:MAG TPA: hypothetical protein VGV15_02875, partial [Terriglobales bacterium]|nr:hypothetical protein [Terriglobales bacterium]